MIDRLIKDITGDLDSFETFEEKDEFLRTTDFGNGRTIQDFFDNPDYEGLKGYVQGYMFNAAKEEFGSTVEGYSLGPVSDEDILENIEKINLNTEFLQKYDTATLENIKKEYEEHNRQYQEYNSEIDLLQGIIKSKEEEFDKDAIYGGALMPKYPLQISEDLTDAPESRESPTSGYEYKKRYDFAGLRYAETGNFLTGTEGLMKWLENSGHIDESGNIQVDSERLFDLEATIPFPENMDSFNRWVYTGDWDATETSPGKLEIGFGSTHNVHASSEVFDPNYRREPKEWEQMYLDPASPDYDEKRANFIEMTEGYTVENGIVSGRFVRGVTGFMDGRDEAPEDFLARRAHPLGVLSTVGTTFYKTFDYLNPLSWYNWMMGRDANVDSDALNIWAKERKATEYNDKLGMSWLEYFDLEIKPSVDKLNNVYIDRTNLSNSYKDTFHEYEEWEDLVQGNKDRWETLNTTALDEILTSEAFSVNDRWTQEDYEAFEKLLKGEK